MCTLNRSFWTIGQHNRTDVLQNAKQSVPNNPQSVRQSVSQLVCTQSYVQLLIVAVELCAYAVVGAIEKLQPALVWRRNKSLMLPTTSASRSCSCTQTQYKNVRTYTHTPSITSLDVAWWRRTDLQRVGHFLVYFLFLRFLLPSVNFSATLICSHEKVKIKNLL